MSAFGDEAADGSATRPYDSSNRVVGAAWSGLLRRTLGTVLRGAYKPLSRRHSAEHVSARGGTMPSGSEDMDLCTDKVLSKGRILQELTKAVKLVSDRHRRRNAVGPPRPSSCIRIHARCREAPRFACRLLLTASSLSTFPFSRKHGYPLLLRLDVSRVPWTLQKRTSAVSGIVVISASSIPAACRHCRSVSYVSCQSRSPWSNYRAYFRVTTAGHRSPYSSALHRSVIPDLVSDAGKINVEINRRRQETCR